MDRDIPGATENGNIVAKKYAVIFINVQETSIFSQDVCLLIDLLSIIKKATQLSHNRWYWQEEAEATT